MWVPLQVAGTIRNLVEVSDTKWRVEPGGCRIDLAVLEQLEQDPRPVLGKSQGFDPGLEEHCKIQMSPDSQLLRWKEVQNRKDPRMELEIQRVHSSLP